jgi:hypothetical protein
MARLYLGPRDYASLKSDKHDCMPWFNTVLELSHDPIEMATNGDLGTWDSVGDYALTLLGHGSLLLVSFIVTGLFFRSPLIHRPTSEHLCYLFQSLSSDQESLAGTPWCYPLTQITSSPPWVILGRLRAHGGRSFQTLSIAGIAIRKTP